MPTTEKDAIVQQLLDAYAMKYEQISWKEMKKQYQVDGWEFDFEVMEKLASLASDRVMKERENNLCRACSKNEAYHCVDCGLDAIAKSREELENKILAERSVHKTAIEQVKDFYEKELEKERIEHSIIVEKTKDYYQRKCDSLNLSLFNLKESSRQTAEAIEEIILSVKADVYREKNKPNAEDINWAHDKGYDFCKQKILEKIKAKYLGEKEHPSTPTTKTGDDGG